MKGLIVFLHGFRGDNEDWGSVPDLVSFAMSSFEITRMEYSGELDSYADLTRSADQILTRLKTEHPSNDPIFLVGYSMGGLIARELCLRLLETTDNNVWLKRVRATITVGTPLSGLQPMVKAVTYAASKFISPKADQVNNNRNKTFVFDRYKEGILSAKERGANGPKQIHIEIENDEISAPHEAAHYTDDDVRAGVVNGTHREFIKSQAQKNRLANLIVQLIRERHGSLGIAKKDSPSISTQQLPERLLLMACSNRKETGGATEYGGPGPASWISDDQLRDEILSKRTQVLSYLKAAQIDNGFEQAENRLHQAPNKRLTRGRDFGGLGEENSDARYLPAWQRYAGRFYAQIRQESWDRYYHENHTEMAVLIMSGLYGLIDAAEWIQEYDIHLTDRILDAGIPIGAMWTDLFTAALIEFVQRAYRGRKIQLINCLCDDFYNDAVHWRRLPKECSVYHLASPDHAHTNLLPAAGTVADCLLRDPHRLDQLERTTRESKKVYNLSDFGSPPENQFATRVVFEARLGDLKEHNT